jgi:hypothetical protein
MFCHLSLLCQNEVAKSLPCVSFPAEPPVARPIRATGGVAGYETPSFPGGESPSEGGGGPSHYYFWKSGVWAITSDLPTTRE